MACTKRPVKILRFDQNEVSDAEYLKMISHSQVDVDQIPIEISDTKIRKERLRRIARQHIKMTSFEMKRHVIRTRDCIYECRTQVPHIRHYYVQKDFNIPDFGEWYPQFKRADFVTDKKLANIYHDLHHRFHGYKSPYCTPPYANVPLWREYLKNKHRVALKEQRQEKVDAMLEQKVQELGDQHVAVKKIIEELRDASSSKHKELPEEVKTDEFYTDLLKELRKLERVSSDVRRPLSSVLPLPTNVCHIRRSRVFRPKTTSDINKRAKMHGRLDCHDHRIDQRVRTFKVPAWRKLIAYIKQCRQHVFTKDNNQDAINTLDRLVADYYRQVADDMIARGHKSYDRAHPYDMSDQERKQFKEMHDLYYPRKRRDILTKNIHVDMDDPAGVATEYLKMIKQRKTLEGENIFLSYSPLADTMAVQDYKDQVAAQRRSASPNP